MFPVLVSFADLFADGDLDKIYMKNKSVISGTIVREQLGIVSLLIPDSIGNSDVMRTIQIADIAKIERRTNAESQALKDKGSLDPKLMNNQLPPTQTSLSDPQSNQMEQGKMHEIVDYKRTLKEGNQMKVPNLSASEATTFGGNYGGIFDEEDAWTPPRMKQRRSTEWIRQIKGYRGFYDYGYTHGFGKVQNHNLTLSTSHGYQFDPIFFLGIGASYTLPVNKKEGSFPIYINPRINFLDSYTTPFWDVRAGYSIVEVNGFYFSTGLGMSFSKGDRYSFNVGLNYTLQNARYEKFTKEEPIELVTQKEKYHGISLRLSFEY